MVPPQTGLLRRVVRGVDSPRSPLRARQRQQRSLRLPITVSVLLQLRAHVERDTLDGALFWFACVLGVLGLLRSGEFVVDESLSASERARRMLRLRHWRVSPSSAILHLPVTKTQPIHGADVHYASGVNAALCPLEAWSSYERIRRRLFAASFLNDSAPLLLDSRCAPLSRSRLLEQLQSTLRVAGLAVGDASRFLGHSFRRGGAQSLLDAGVQVDAIRTAGRWRSDAVFRYFTSSSTTARSLAPLFARAASAPRPAQ